MMSRAKPKGRGHTKPTKHVAKPDESCSAGQHEIFPFLALPLEIRVMIMKYYFGSHTVHIIPEQLLTTSTRGPRDIIPARLDHRLCMVGTNYWRSRQTNEVQDKLLGGPPVEYEESHVDWNLGCHHSYGGASSVLRRLDINLLFVNRQIYQEAAEIL